MSKKRFVWVFLCLFSLAMSLSAQCTLLHSFVGTTSDGSDPYGSLVASGSTLYGMTSSGGAYNLGTIFKINMDGTGYAVLHSFAGAVVGAPTDGANPKGSLTLSGSTLYGMTSGGGIRAGEGTIFKINTDGTGFAVLYSFGSNGNGYDAAWPDGSLTLSGSTLYGMTTGGGTSGNGTIFKINTNGTGYSVFYSFAGMPTDGQWPEGALILSGSTLYGMTGRGGTSNTTWYEGMGTIFKINTDGTGYAVLHFFADSPSDGTDPCGDLVRSGSTLYGMTNVGGTTDSGVIFKINTNGTGFGLLHSFGVADSDMELPVGSLIVNGSTLLGMACDGGTCDCFCGAIFKINTDGTGLEVLHSFAGKPSDGGWPWGSLTLSGSTLYGMTLNGGVSDLGVVFSYSGSLTTKAKPLAGGTITPAGTNWHSNGQSILVQATSKAGYVFSGWSGDLAGWTNPATVIVNGTKSITGHFMPGKTLLPPILVGPPNGAIVLPLSNTLTWIDTNSSPQELHYKVRIKRAGGAYKYYVLDANTASEIISGLISGKTYSWNVQALGSGTKVLNSAWANKGVDYRFTTALPSQPRSMASAISWHFPAFSLGIMR